VVPNVFKEATIHYLQLSTLPNNTRSAFRPLGHHTDHQAAAAFKNKKACNYINILLSRKINTFKITLAPSSSLGQA